MKTKYIIRNIKGDAFYSLSKDRFGGRLFADRFDTYEEAEDMIEQLIDEECYIQKIYNAEE